eukprot:TRINITY_DN19127_c0_g1_i1.p1 TRINITY_DN19127_c0_g1~~TRINITY_DN19127_c0_g1_i1.p1  ORF type:complete len:241 (+),score=16.58 TRINITY_DN19127_c0_g1_i1:66-725(+)
MDFRRHMFVPQVHPYLLLRPRSDSHTQRQFDVISSRKPSTRTVFPCARTKTYVPVCHIYRRMKGFFFEVELRGLWTRRDRVLIGALSSKCSVNMEYVLQQEPLQQEPPVSAISGVWFCVSSRSLIFAGGEKLYCAELPSLPAKKSGVRLAFKLDCSGQVWIGVCAKDGDKKEMRAVGPQLEELVGESAPAILLQPHTRANEANEAAVVRLDKVTDLTSS